MIINAIVSLYGLDAYSENGIIYVIKKGKSVLLTTSEKAAVDIEVKRLLSLDAIEKHNRPLLKDISDLDQRRIRPLAEGDTVFLAKLNAQIAALRIQLK